MRLLLLVLLSVSVVAEAAPKKKKKDDSVQLWDGSDADVSWVNENQLPARAAAPRMVMPWLSLGLSGGHRIFANDAVIQLKDSQDRILNEGRFLDLIKPQNAFEARAHLHLFSFMSLGVIYHLDQAQLRVNNQYVAIDPQELAASLQIGPRLGRLRLYAFYNHIVLSQSRDRVTASTLVTDSQEKQTFDIDIKQTGGSAGVGAQVRFGTLGLFAEGMQSVNRTFDLTIKQGDAAFHTTAKPQFKAWQLGLSLDF